MQKDVIIIGAGPAGIFTALEMLKKGSRQRVAPGTRASAISWARSRVIRPPPEVPACSWSLSNLRTFPVAASI